MRLLAAVALSVALVSGCGSNVSPPPSQPRLLAQTPAVAPSSSAPVRKVADPERIRIPSIGVDAPVMKVGLLPNRDMETPPADKNMTGWYSPKTPKGKKRQFRPGENGPAVIAGHVDSKKGPDVFARLGELKHGAEILVTDKAGKTYAFKVADKTQTDKDQLDHGAIWGPTDSPALRLITCGGSFDGSTGHYRDNVTIYADAA
jgi:hypothetical protein